MMECGTCGPASCRATPALVIVANGVRHHDIGCPGLVRALASDRLHSWSDGGPGFGTSEEPGGSNESG